MIRHVVFGLILLFPSLSPGAGVTNYDCSTANNAKVRINQIYNPQTGNETGYLELYVDNGPVNLEGWHICYGDGSHSKCVDIGKGNGNVYVDGALIGNDGDASAIPDNAFVVFSETLFATSGEAVLLDPNGDAAHYLRYYNSTFNQADWSAGSECTTNFQQPTANNNGICATPDFSQPDAQWSYNCADTMGTYNADPASPLAEWRMDECGWNGTASEVQDTKSSHHGTSRGLNDAGRVATTIEGGILNRAGEFKGEGYNADPYNTWYPARYYLDVPDSDPLSPLSITRGAQMGITGWFKLDNVSDTHTILHKGGSHQEYRLFVEGGKLYFTVWDIWGAPKTIGISTPLVAGHYYFFAATAKGGLLEATPLELALVLKDGISTYTQSGTFHLFTYNLPKDEKLYFGATNWGSGSITNFLKGSVDEIKLYGKALTSSEIDRLYTYESSGRNYTGTARSPSACGGGGAAVRFDAWDSFRSISDRSISTKIVGKPFDLSIASLNDANTAPENFTGTVCARLADSANSPLGDWTKLAFHAEQTKTATFTLGRAVGGSDSAGVQIVWKKDADEACPLAGETGSTTASDRFALRPASFTLSAPNATAGVDFNLTFTAPGYGAIAASPSYNETSGGSFDLTVAEHTAGCTLGTFTPSLTPLSFADGARTVSTRYGEAGVIDITLGDTAKACAATFARVDCDDPDVAGHYARATDLWIGSVQHQIAVRPYAFDLSAVLSDFAGGEFTYLSDAPEMSAQLSLSITAKNAQGGVTQNYSGACYAKETTLTLEHTAIPAPLSRILHTNTLTGSTAQTPKGDPIVLSLPKSLYANGTAAGSLTLNFDRDRSKPLSPFDFSFTADTTVADADGVSNAGDPTGPAGTATFVFGRVQAYDITTNVSPVPIPVEFEIYSSTPSGYVGGMPQNSLGWYRHLNHDTAGAGNVIRGGFSAGATDGAIDASALPANGIQAVGVSASEDKTVHLDISPWLWYSPAADYSYGGGCTQHPCFRYDYTGSAASPGVTTGTFKGSDFEMKPAKNITNKGVKVFR